MTDDGARPNNHASGSDRAMRIIAAIQRGETKDSFVCDEHEAAMWDRLARGTQAHSTKADDRHRQ